MSAIEKSAAARQRVGGAVVDADASVVEGDVPAREDHVVQEPERLVVDLGREQRVGRAREHLRGVIGIEQHRAHAVAVRAIGAVVDLEPAAVDAERA